MMRTYVCAPAERNVAFEPITISKLHVTATPSHTMSCVIANTGSCNLWITDGYDNLIRPT